MIGEHSQAPLESSGRLQPLPRAVLAVHNELYDPRFIWRFRLPIGTLDAIRQGLPRQTGPVRLWNCARL